MNEGGKTARSDLLGGAGWLFFGLLIVVESLRMDRFTSMGAELYTMPGFVPGMIGSVIMLLGGVLMLRGWNRRAASREDAPAAPLLNRRITLTMALSLAYAGGLIGRAPFWLATFLFVTAFVACFTPPDTTPLRRGAVAVLAGVLTAAIVTLVFERIFLVRLP